MKNVIITGCAKGLGLETSKMLAKAGYKVLGVSRTPTEEYQQLQASFPETVFFYEFDFCNVKDISALVKLIVKKHGRIFGLINNAALGHDGVLATMHESDISLLLKVNIEAPILLTKYVARSMLLNRGGRIVNVGSIIASTGFNGLSVYGATKSAIGGFTKSLARELGKSQITVNTLAPGYMETNMTDGLVGDKLEKIKRRSCLGRLANVKDVASMALFLLSEDAAGITGTTFTVDAGSTA
ncbi:3-oxoacyl-[acyl-carrier-protein] reductase FabG [Plesiomonas shigelloides]|uniref:SDR family NAD(P)-dependent oxidoreductase n=1 Tax=Plesiomonas shigelloides TaxID=703 RepID=UPI000D9CA868|nr:SDR family oxidoreductase [Plesiomonas shigelloides]SPZ45721.1 3-oxoacyl-[acyl-carrier-protein] reductase FabG [Plesiomonas shigelloides]